MGFDTLTNATAIGANAVVSESNAIVLGDTGVNQVNVGIGTTTPAHPLHVISNASVTGYFENTNITSEAYALTATSDGTGLGNVGISGSAVHATIQNVGVEGQAQGDSSNLGVWGRATAGSIAYGVYGQGNSASTINYGGYFTASGYYHFPGYSGTAYGLYATAQNAVTLYAGYFNGSVYTTGSYLPSDRKLKNNIEPLTSAIDIITRLNPATYIYNTDEYKYMNLPKGKRYGLIADEIEQVLPNLVAKALQPAEYDRHDKKNPKKLADAVEFNAVNYTELIPILIGAIKEQEKKFEDQRTKMAEMEKEIEKLKSKIK